MALLVAGAVAASAAEPVDKRVFVESCGNARPDMRVCLLWNTQAQRGNLAFTFPGNVRQTMLVSVARGERAGIDWYTGYGTLEGQRLYLWLRVDDSGAQLPVKPSPPRTAAVFYRQTPNQKWQPYPLTTQFLFAEVK